MRSSSLFGQKALNSISVQKQDGLLFRQTFSKLGISFKQTWDSFVAPVITEDTLGFEAHHAIAS